ncbi:MAG: ribosome biogenesis GTPase Der [Ruminococcaceae bacterium]|nr:ribosome biogenesis GTPase Der [Oscillospiraceae bacterium]
MAKPIVAIVGRPNVGKSTFFNKISGQRISIVADTPGVTRDRIYFQIRWNGRDMVLIDTGGIESRPQDEIVSYIKEQAELAMETADVIIYMADIRAGVTAEDRELAAFMKRSGKPVILAVNKVDSIGELPLEFYEFYELGYEYGPFALSSIHGTGSGDILDQVCELLPPQENEEDDKELINVAVIGRPNAGKSSLINKILGEKRLIVSDVAGTTRDAVDSRVENKHGVFNLIDTAGIRRNARINDSIEKYSVIRSKLAVERADVCVLLIDASDGTAFQDARIAGIAHEVGKASVIAVNKWDLIDKDNETVKNYTKEIYNMFPYMTYAPVVYISAKTGQRIDRLFEEINAVHLQSLKRITTGMLNDLLNDATSRVQPPTDKGRRLKIYYMTQTGVQPPEFVIFCNKAELFHFSYQRYIENCLREAFGFRGTPIRLVIREKGESAPEL